MSIQTDIMTALNGVANDQVFPDAPPEGVNPPLVLVRRTAYDPVMLLTGPEGTAQSKFLFECWGVKTPTVTAKASAMAMASQVKAALLIAAPTMTMYQEPVDGEQFDPDTLEVMEPLAYSFWHVDS